MRYAVSSGLVLAGLALIIGTPATLTAGLFGPGPCHTCFDPCNVCQVNPCACSHPAPVAPQVRVAPPVTIQPQVQMVPQTVTVPQVSYRDVTRTEYRTEAQTSTVPVTTYQTVTVDEGQWQQVWVPRIVQKQVPQVSYQQQVSYRQVPYQVTQRVPEVRYQTQTTMVPHTTNVARSGCAPCQLSGMAAAPHYAAPSIASAPLSPIATAPLPPPVASPSPAAMATVPPPPVALPQQAIQQPVILGPELQPLSSFSGSRYPAAASEGLEPVPDPKYLDTPSSRTSDVASQSTWEPLRTADSSTGLPPAPRTSSASGRFVPAPAAADIWRTRIR